MGRLIKLVMVLIIMTVVACAAPTKETRTEPSSAPQVTLCVSGDTQVYMEHYDRRAGFLAHAALLHLKQEISRHRPDDPVDMTFEIHARSHISYNHRNDLSIEGMACEWYPDTRTAKIYVLDFQTFIERGPSYRVGTDFRSSGLDTAKFIVDSYVVLLIHEMVHGYLFSKGVGPRSVHEYLAYAASMTYYPINTIGTLMAFTTEGLRHPPDNLLWINELGYMLSPDGFGEWSFIHYYESGGRLFNEIVEGRFTGYVVSGVVGVH